jgi:hypothetical protein
MNEENEIVNFGVPGKSKYPFEKLRVGKAMLYTDLTKYQSLRSTAVRLGKSLKRKFSVRKITEKDKKTGAAVKKIAVVRIK